MNHLSDQNHANIPAPLFLRPDMVTLLQSQLAAKEQVPASTGKRIGAMHFDTLGDAELPGKILFNGVTKGDEYVREMNDRAARLFIQLEGDLEAAIVRKYLKEKESPDKTVSFAAATSNSPRALTMRDNDGTIQLQHAAGWDKQRIRVYPGPQYREITVNVDGSGGEKFGELQMSSVRSVFESMSAQLPSQASATLMPQIITMRMHSSNHRKMGVRMSAKIGLELDNDVRELDSVAVNTYEAAPLMTILAKRVGKMIGGLSTEASILMAEMECIYKNSEISGDVRRAVRSEIPDLVI